jgi:hypothetical protein
MRGRGQVLNERAVNNIQAMRPLSEDDDENDFQDMPHLSEDEDADSICSVSPFAEDDDVQTVPMATRNDSLDQFEDSSAANEGNSAGDDSVGPQCPCWPYCEPTTLTPERVDEPLERLAAARDNITPQEREFRAAQRDNGASGERPRTAGSDRRCMAALVKVNGLEAYTLLDSGSTTVSVTHDFA